MFRKGTYLIMVLTCIVIQTSSTAGTCRWMCVCIVTQYYSDVCGLTWWPRSRSLSPLRWQHRWCRTGASPPPLCHPSLFYTLWSSALDCWGCTAPDSTRRHQRQPRDNQFINLSIDLTGVLHLFNTVQFAFKPVSVERKHRILPVCEDMALLSHKGSQEGWCLWALYPADRWKRDGVSQVMYCIRRARRNNDKCMTQGCGSPHLRWKTSLVCIIWPTMAV